MTLAKLAKLAHVSISTVSKAFSMSPGVNEKTREAIFEIARANGCFYQFFNAKYQRYVIAVICGEFKSRFYAEAMSLIQEQLMPHHCEISVATTNFSPDAEREILDYYTKYSSVDGIILFDCQTELADDLKIPIATIFPYCENKNPISAKRNQIGAMKTAVAHFLDKGVLTIGFINDTVSNFNMNTFYAAMKDLNVDINPKYICITEHRFEFGGYSAMAQMIEEHRVPRALICSYDSMAIGAIRCLSEYGLRVPEDVAVMGINNIREDSYLNPPLSSIDPQIDLACRFATEAMLDHLLGDRTERHTAIESTLHLRKSTEI
ncbi:MAG: LacI family DNA-binding transcriptional regulator [Clostridia bacterium]|nr:LacI family DNA-binding transcriptional regulator [Clostridia bacterium]